MGLEHICHLRHLLDGWVKFLTYWIKGLDIPYFYGISDCPGILPVWHCHISQITHKLHDRHHHTGKELGFPCGVVKFSIDLVKLSDHVLFLIKCFDYAVPAVDFLPGHLHFPRYSCWPRKYFWECFITNEISSTEIGKSRIATSVISGLMESIIISTPMIVVTDVIIWGRTLVQTLPQGIHVVCHAGKHLAHRFRIKNNSWACG